MIPYEEALEIVHKNTKTGGTEQVDLFAAGDRVLREYVKADMDNPPFTNSAMDGYAVKAGDTKGASRENPVVILVHPGEYRETIVMKKNHVFLIGKSRDSVTITRQYSPGKALGFGDATFNLQGNPGGLANLSITNTGGKSAAISLFCHEGVHYIDNCHIYSNGRDTILASFSRRHQARQSPASGSLV